MNRPETHEVYREWRRLADSYEPPRVLLGEVYVLDVPAWATYYGSGSDELNLAFNFALVHSGLDADEMRGVVARTEEALPPGRLALLDRVEPRCRAASRPAGAAMTRRSPAARCSCS